MRCPDSAKRVPRIAEKASGMTPAGLIPRGITLLKAAGCFTLIVSRVYSCHV